jgi:predicted permease
MGQDLRYALRAIARQPWLAVAIVLTLALGLGLNVGVFTVIDGIMFRARVEKDPASFVHLSPEYRYQRPTREPPWLISWRDYQAFSAEAHALSDLSAWAVVQATMNHEEKSTPGMLVTCNFFRVYGLAAPAEGRLFSADECSRSDARVVVLSEEFVKDRYGPGARAVGQTVLINRAPFTVVGVLPAGFSGRLRGPGIWIPCSSQPIFYDNRDFFREDLQRWLNVEGRLAPGRARAEARSELAVIAARQDAFEPGRKSLLLLTNGSFGEEPSLRGLVFWVDGLLMTALLLILLIACTNITVLQLSRAVDRRREMGIRLALGAQRSRLMRMLLTEILVLSIAAGLLSLVVAYESPGLFRKLLAATVATPVFQMRPDLRVFIYLCIAALTSAAVAGLSPAAESLRLDVAGAMKTGESSSAAGARRVHGVLMGAQVAMSLGLLFAAVLFLRAQHRMFTADPGFETRQVLSVVLRKGIDAPKVSTALRDVPRVDSVAVGSPFSGGEFDFDLEEVRTAGQQVGAGKRARVNTVSGNFFNTLHIELLRGRAPVNSAEAAVSQAFAQTFWNEREALGQRATLYDGTGVTVVAITRNIQTEHVGIPDSPVLYRWHAPDSPATALVVRFKGDARDVAPLARDALRRVDPDARAVPKTLRNLLDEQAEAGTLLIRMIGVLGLLALSLSALGIYGVVAFAVSRRTKELGIRMALGATRALIVRSVFAAGFRPVALGLAAGILLALAAGESLASFMRKTPIPIVALDPLGLIAVVALLSVVAILAMLKPALRAAATDPARSLRDA